MGKLKLGLTTVHLYIVVPLHVVDEACCKTIKDRFNPVVTAYVVIRAASHDCGSVT